MGAAWKRAEISGPLELGSCRLSATRGLTFEPINETNCSRSLRTTGLACEAEVTDVLHVLHLKPLRLLVLYDHNQKICGLKKTECSIITLCLFSNLLYIVLSETSDSVSQFRNYRNCT